MAENDFCLYEGLRIYRNGDIERNFKRMGWKKVRNHNNKGDGYNVLTVKKKQLLRHRLVVAAFNPEFNIDTPTDMVDHIDNDRLNNSFENLRVVTPQANTFNTKAKGYSWFAKSGKWRAAIRKDGKDYYLGLHDTEEAAREAYLKAKAEHHVIQPIC